LVVRLNAQFGSSNPSSTQNDSEKWPTMSEIMTEGSAKYMIQRSGAKKVAKAAPAKKSEPEPRQQKAEPKAKSNKKVCSIKLLGSCVF